MSTSKIYNIGESSLSEKPKRGLSLLIKDGAIKSNMIDTGAITIEKLDADISKNIQILDKIKDAVEEWPTEKLQHTIKWGDTPSIVAVGDTIQWPTEVVEWNPKIEKYNEEDTIEYEKVLECANGDEVDWKTQENWSKSELGNNKFIITFSYPVGEYKEESNLGSERIVIVPHVNEGRLEKVVKVTYPWYIDNKSQELIAIGKGTTVIYTTKTSPVIKVPFKSSTISVEADIALNGNYNPVANWVSTTEIVNGITYKVYYGEDSFSEPVPHRITIKIIEDNGI